MEEEEKKSEKPDTEAKKAMKRKAAPIVGKPKVGRFVLVLHKISLVQEKSGKSL